MKRILLLLVFVLFGNQLTCMKKRKKVVSNVESVKIVDPSTILCDDVVYAGIYSDVNHFNFASGSI